jgi:hypothetical protein
MIVSLDGREHELTTAEEAALRRAAVEPLDVDISDYSDEWCAGFLRGQVNALGWLLANPLNVPMTVHAYSVQGTYDDGIVAQTVATLVEAAALARRWQQRPAIIAVRIVSHDLVVSAT